MIYLDLDGVFANFDKAVLEHTGFSYQSNPRSAWPVLDKIPHFFSTLEPLPGAVELFNQIANTAMAYGERVAILTALPLNTNELRTAERDKKDWVAHYLSPEIDVICVPNWSYKAELANNESILLDDSARNIKAWCEKGGIGILHQPEHCRATLEAIIAFLSLKFLYGQG